MEVTLYFEGRKKINAIQPKDIVATDCAMLPTNDSMAALILLLCSRVKILPRKSPVLFGKNIPAVMPVKMA